MDVKELEQLDCPPEEHWYYKSKFDLLAATVDRMGARRVADIGAGSGVFARLLLQRTDCQSPLHRSRRTSAIMRSRWRKALRFGRSARGAAASTSS